ncbi:DUF4367 domain-containing protein [Clostridium autoethanogenum]|uniref:DUF4367 domain-containing protein n=3 Tax=Clostridium autoethanogenum TaxID=84023 RepID=A0A3M0STC2_9CLOT|nr:DUF4367 domain-containing protein [Clostridium autoethanogenum]AGY75211.2 DUF4367 domain-containing protein [Clostridium autoethanogenum DSM 10061]RMD01659.1 DUF4367 domain-containing protein [Clostridium autoethanogenum]
MGRLNMRDNMKNFRNESNEILKDICVTDELKRKTLERCSNRRSLQLKPVLIASAVFVILIFTFKLYNFSHKTDIARSYVKPDQKYVDKSINNDHKGTIDNETSKEISKANKIGNSIVQDKSNAKNSTKNVSSNKDTRIQNKNILPQNTNNYNIETPSTNQENEKEDDKNHGGDLGAVRPSGVASLGESLSMKDAEKYFESKVLLPSYVPEGFELSNISIPCEGVKSISIKYSLNSKYFIIQESKSLSGLKGDKTLYIGAGKAYINYFKDEQATSVSWIMNNVEYSLYGNIQENSLIDIANSIK